MKKPSALNLTVYIIVRIVVLSNGVLALVDGRIFTALQCLLSLVLFMLPTLLERRFKIELPSTLELIVILFIFASTFLGEVGGYYDRYRLWDTLLHVTSGFLTTAIGFSMIDILNRSEHVKFTLSAGFVALFAFCFSMTIGVVWEFYEFAMDMIFVTDMQKDTIVHEFSSVLLDLPAARVESAVLNGVELDGWLDIGLIDTMKDLLVCAVGAVMFSVFGYIYVKTREQKWITRLMPRKK
ncbi:MAG: hypothetical protein IJ428_00135 [Clostridia bacterium]|nr:hypothetical protein [Clostridia bacterium]